MKRVSSHFVGTSLAVTQGSRNEIDTDQFLSRADRRSCSSHFDDSHAIAATFDDSAEK